MNAKATLDTLNSLVRQVFRSFYPEHFIVVNEFIRHTDYMTAQELAKCLNLAETTVTKSLNDLKTKRFVGMVKYGDLAFYFFDYASFVNIVRFKVHMLKANEAQNASSSSSLVAKTIGQSNDATYVCLTCNRSLPWEQFVKLANPVCQSRGCGGKLQKATKRTAEMLKPLEVLAAALRKLQGQEIPCMSARKADQILKETVARENENNDSGLQYEAPELMSTSKYVVQFVGSGVTEKEGFIVPPELEKLSGLLEEEEKPRKTNVPPWLRPVLEEEEEDVKKNEDNVNVQWEDEEEGHVSAMAEKLSLDSRMRCYYAQLVRSVDHRIPMDVDNDADAAGLDWDPDIRPIPMVSVAGTSMLMSQVGPSEVSRMSEEEYKAYFEAYEREKQARLKILLGNV